MKKEIGSNPKVTMAPSDSPPLSKAIPAEKQPTHNKRSFRLTFDLLGKTDESRFEGKITVSSAGRTILGSDTILLRGFRQERAYSREFDVTGLDLSGAGLRWEVNGTLFDSDMKESLTIRNTDSRKFTEPFQYIGFHVSTVGGKLTTQTVLF